MVRDGGKSATLGEESEILLGGDIFLPGGGNLRTSGFDHSKLFQR